MKKFFQDRSVSLFTVVIVLIFATLLQSGISYSTTFGRLKDNIQLMSWVPISFLSFRFFLIILAFLLWCLERKKMLFKVIILVNSFLTLGLILNIVALLDVLVGFSSGAVKALILGVIFLFGTGSLIHQVLRRIQETMMRGISCFPKGEEKFLIMKTGYPNIQIIYLLPSPPASLSVRPILCLSPDGLRS
jgi:hypothetical protein